MSTRRSDSGVSRRTPRHQWTADQKRCLLLLSKHFHLSDDRMTVTFNKVFRREIKSQDFPDGLPLKSVRAQYREHGQDDNVSWSKIMHPEDPIKEARLQDRLVERIEHSLQAGNPDSEKEIVVTLAAPKQTSRKRKVAASDHGKARVPDTDDFFHPLPRETKRVRRAAMVVVPAISKLRISDHVPVEDTTPAPQTSRKQTSRPKPGLLSSPNSGAPRTPKTQTKRTETGLLTPPETVRKVRLTGPALDVPAEKLAQIEAGYVPPSDAEAHPPLGGLFYRFWDTEQSQGQNSSQGFIAKRYIRSNAVPVRAYAPPAEYLDPTDLWMHLDEQPETTPFVSVSDSLAWSLSKSLKLVKSGKWKQAKLSIIDANKLSSASIFHAAGFYRQLKKLCCFTNGAHRGVSSHEYLVWRDIPEAAMIKTINVSDIYASTATSRDLAALLRLGILRSVGGYQTRIRPRLREGGVGVTPVTAASIASTAQLLGLTHDSPFAHHRHVVSDIVGSYRMTVRYHDSQAWRTIASHYTHTFIRKSATPVPAKTQALLNLAFLEGVRLGASHDFRLAKIAEKTVTAVQRKAQLIGLEDPSRVVCEDADAVKLHSRLEQKKQWKVFEVRSSRGLLEEAEEQVEADGEGEGSVFGFGEDGIVE